MGMLYSLVVACAAVLAAPWYLLRSGLRSFPNGYWSERLGRVPESIRAPGRTGSIWIHAVSVGETLAIAGLAGEIGQRFRGHPIYLSHVTPAGRSAGEGRIQNVAGRFFLPVDLKACLRPFFEHLRPKLLIIAETELWPNLLRVAREYGTRVVLVNARLSERSFRGYARFGFFFRGVARSTDWIFAQTDQDAERFRRLGAARVSVAGNLKFDARPPQRGELPRAMRPALEGSGRGPVLVAGSTMAGEERLVLRAWDAIRSRYPQALLILAPRHPQRFEEVADLLAGDGRRFSRRTSLDPMDLESQLTATDIVLLNTIGELAGVFELADVAFVGGSLVPTGGHNLLEPAFWAKPVLFGPHMENFRDIAQQFLAVDAAIRVTDPESFAARVVELFGDAELRNRVGERAQRLVQSGSGATHRIVERLSEWLTESIPLEVGEAAAPVEDRVR
ncbi:MAG TPA: 3-deoxy-D-manno-octulosonic acid transferase [Terriglobia bacterium]|nr:3-deoxy-D-manno-octulosonic acid transferase [Terriglobia bacterium]